MSDEQEHSEIASGGGLIGLIILGLIGWWGYNTFFKSYDKPWFDDTAIVRACTSRNSGCRSVEAMRVHGEIITLWINGQNTGFFQSMCGKDDIGRFCMGETRAGQVYYILP